MSRWKQLRQQFKNAVLICSWLYSFCLFIYIIARFTVGERFILVEIANSLLPFILFPIAIVILIGFSLRKWRIFILLLPALLFATNHYGYIYLPKNLPVQAQEALHIRFLTFNVGSQVENSQQIAELILEADADIVALQELQTPMAENLEALLSEEYPYQALHPSYTFAIGVGIFSKYPLVDDIYLDQLILGGQHTQVEIESDNEFSIFNVHPISPRVLGGFDSSRRSSEIESVLEIAEETSNSVLLMGDFNITDANDDYARITSQYEDAFKQAGTGFGLTFPNLAQFTSPLGLLPPLLRIDYIFYNDTWLPIESYIISNHGGSDHYPLFAELALGGID